MEDGEGVVVTEGRHVSRETGRGVNRSTNRYNCPDDLRIIPSVRLYSSTVKLCF